MKSSETAWTHCTFINTWQPSSVFPSFHFVLESPSAPWHENPWNTPHLWCSIFGRTKSPYTFLITPQPHLQAPATFALAIRPQAPRAQLRASQKRWLGACSFLNYADEMQIGSRTDGAVFAVCSPLSRPPLYLKTRSRRFLSAVSPVTDSFLHPSNVHKDTCRKCWAFRNLWIAVW